MVKPSIVRKRTSKK